MITDADVDALLAQGDPEAAAFAAAQLANPAAHLAAMIRCFHASQRIPFSAPHTSPLFPTKGRTAMFELDEAKAKLSSYTPRRELHGEDPKPAATLRFDVTLPAADLAMFSPTLRHSLYYHNDAVQGQVDAVNQMASANDLRYPEIHKPLAWEYEITGGELAIDYGLSGSSDIVLPGCDCDEFMIDPMPGGMVVVSFRVACHPDEKQSGKLAFMIGRDNLKISLAPPKPEQDLAGDKKPPKRSRNAPVDRAIA